ncbi:putative FAD-containing monooxygenase MymA [Posidoniimonas corsicana]|uniref:Putative FAD-containing monooxygenase MymA n=1 Tax=Posidoniimonas corsicana TaxID=1938618 RepID=A0A5C5VE88_9BACT|nr:FAD/NAD(P)-binding protein [Posidoniimonas corsicana]TWT36928.1 putative FAD-containing monooxygenase MymA [Posidoniimonas corsicana]
MNGDNTPRRLAIIGAGSSGLISLKHAIDALPNWEVRCFEESDRVTGAWGRPYDGFVSTSTKYTTQFSCYPRYDATVRPDGGASRGEFFRDGEYGEYLQDFADHFDLRRHISHGCRVTAVRRPAGGHGWDVTFHVRDIAQSASEQFDAVIICTGLVAEPRPLGDQATLADLRRLCSTAGLAEITGKTVVVIGGGEMAADFANRLAQPAAGNRVYLSLRSGIRVSPRYHPIRGVPSDFLRNRLMLSIHPDIRNWIGQRFVAARIRHQGWFEWLFPSSSKTQNDAGGDVFEQRKRWGRRLNRHARHGLFDMFHNKSDDFLTAVAEGRLQVVGPPTDATLTRYEGFDGDAPQQITPDVVVPAVGFRSRLGELLGDQTNVSDFYLGCCHAEHDDLFLVGFARPVIGNIPSISEVQARLVTRLIAGQTPRPDGVGRLNAADAAARRERYGGVDTRLIYPVEMFPYCDQLAALMQAGPRPRTLRDRWTQLTAPATTLDYDFPDDNRLDAGLPRPPRYLPLPLIMLLFALKPVDWLYRSVPGRR